MSYIFTAAQKVLHPLPVEFAYHVQLYEAERGSFFKYTGITGYLAQTYPTFELKNAALFITNDESVLFCQIIPSEGECLFQPSGKYFILFDGAQNNVYCVQFVSRAQRDECMALLQEMLSKVVRLNFTSVKSKVADESEQFQRSNFKRNFSIKVQQFYGAGDKQQLDQKLEVENFQLTAPQLWTIADECAGLGIDLQHIMPLGDQQPDVELDAYQQQQLLELIILGRKAKKASIQSLIDPTAFSKPLIHQTLETAPESAEPAHQGVVRATCNPLPTTKANIGIVPPATTCMSDSATVDDSSHSTRSIRSAHIEISNVLKSMTNQSNSNISVQNPYKDIFDL